MSSFVKNPTQLVTTLTTFLVALRSDEYDFTFLNLNLAHIFLEPSTHVLKALFSVLKTNPGVFTF